MHGLAPYLLVAAAAALLSWLFTPVVRAVAARFGAVAPPNDRTVHAVATPTLGGIALLFAFLGGLLLASRLPAFHTVFESSEPLGIAVGASLMLCIGALDDLRELSAPAKLAGQIFAAGVMTLLGVQVLGFWLPLVGNIGLSPDVGAPLTVIVVVVTVNAVNLIDGLDGLAAGIVAIAAAAYFVYSYRTGSAGVIAEASAAPLVAALIVGICVGFLPHNFNPAKIFMGDAGSMLLGTLLAGATISGVGASTSGSTASDAFALVIPIAIPLLVLALPFFDTAFAIVRRMRAGTAIMTADKDHLHHRLLDIGHSHRMAVLLLWAWSALLAGSAVALAFTGPHQVLPAFLLAIVLGIILLLVPGRIGRRPPPPSQGAEQRGSATAGRR